MRGHSRGHHASPDETLAMIALSEAGGGGGAAAVATTFVFRPGGVAHDNVYTTWPSLYAALNAAAPVSPQGHRSPTWIQIDDSVSPAIMPAGTYNVDAVTFSGVANFNNASGSSAMTLADGVHFITSLLSFFLVAVSCAPTTPVITVGPSQELWLFLNSLEFTVTGGTAPFLLVDNTGFADIILQQNATIGDGTHVAANAGAGPDNLFVLAYGSFHASPVSCQRDPRC
jgi:hypothetical protein